MKDNKISLFDGIKVSVNSDEEELDYEDDLPEDDSGSIDQEIDKVVTADKQPAESLMLGATSSMMTDEQNEQIIMNNPHLRKLLNKMLDERIADAQQRGESSGSQILSRLTLPTQQGRINTQVQGKVGGGVLVTKSPSDMTIYVPALNRSNRYNELQPEIILDSERMKRRSREVDLGTNNEQSKQAVLPQKVDLMQDKSDKTNVMLKISNFVDQMQIQSKETDQQQQMDQGEQSLNRPRSSINAPGLDEAQRRMEQAIVETEKFKVAVENSPGMLPLNTMLQGINQFEVPTELNLVEQQDHPGVVRQVIGAGGISDDDFFHLTCHIEPNLKKKIENTEFVDLDKLLPKDQTFQGRSVTTNETKLEWVQSEGSTYLVPAKSVSRSIVSDSGNKLLGCMLPFIVPRIQIGLERFGSISQLLTQHQCHTTGTMFTIMT